MKFTHLETFRAVAAAGSFTRAAQNLFMTQPTITAHIQALERELDCQLFIRSYKETRLTPKGEKLNAKISQIFTMLDDIKGSLQGAGEQFVGELKIGASSVMSNNFLTPALIAFSKRNPRVNITVTAGNSFAVAKWIQDGFLELGFSPMPQGFTTLSCIPVHTEQCVFVSHAGVDVSKDVFASRFASMPVVLREKGTKIYEHAVDWLKKHTAFDKKSNPVVTLTTMEGIKNFLLHGDGVTIIPRCCVQEELLAGKLLEIPCPAPLPDIKYFAIFRKNDVLGDIAARFFAEVQSMADIRIFCTVRILLNAVKMISIPVPVRLSRRIALRRDTVLLLFLKVC